MNIEEMYIIGISVRTTNKNNQSVTDLGSLWSRYYVENISEQVTNKISSDVYVIYTDYESDYTGTYTAIIGLLVDGIITVPKGLTGYTFKHDNFQIFTAKGIMPDAVINTWTAIWQDDRKLKRKYTYDVEVYSAKAWVKEDAEVDIYIAV
jgi:predicted transcriptional regulator YdeE